MEGIGGRGEERDRREREEREIEERERGREREYWMKEGTKWRKRDRGEMVTTIGD
jgi:hypothetical protein